MKVVLTGAHGFLGWHTRLRLHACTPHDVRCLTRENWTSAPSLVRDADVIIHLAGVNRGRSATDIEQGNIRLANDIAGALETLSGDRPCPRIVYANTVQEGNGTPYGQGKLAARLRLEAIAAGLGGDFVDVRLPNIFGEHGRPHYNSFVATFVHAVVNDEAPTVRDRQVALLHAQDAASSLLQGLTASRSVIHPETTEAGVREVLELLSEFKSTYESGEIPSLDTPFRVDLFNTYRAALFPHHYPIPLRPSADHRGTFVETVRCRGGEGQSAFSTTLPGKTRGEHYHLRKIERFAVIRGQATISLRKMFTDDVISFPVSGVEPAAIDMPIGWTHSITNTGSHDLLTQFWAHELYRPEDPDTFPEPVRTGRHG